MGKFARLMDVLDLYAGDVALLTAEDVAERLQISRPTAFRYVKELTAAGLLANYSGRYALGARIITLDCRIRETDPLLKAAQPVMQVLSAETACASILCRMYNDEVINVHQQPGYDVIGAIIGRGRPLPLFRGAPSKVMLAWMPTARLHRLYQRHADDPDKHAIAPDWPAFKQYFAEIRRRGYYLSIKEVDPLAAGISAPIIVADVGLVGVLSLVFATERLAMINVEGYAAIVQGHAQHIGATLADMAKELPAPA